MYKNPPSKEDIAEKNLITVTKQSNNISAKQTPFQKDIPEKKHNWSHPINFLKP